MRTIGLFSFLLLWFFSNSLSALELPVPQVEYSAVREVHSAQGTFQQKLFFASGKERLEMAFENMKMILIQRPDKKLAWQLMPMVNMYSTISMDKGREISGTPPDNVSIELLGEENINGQTCKKYKLLMKDKSAGGYIWFNEQNIAVKMDFVAVMGKGRERVNMQLKDLQVGKQDPTLFEIPSGYLAMPGIPGF